MSTSDQRGGAPLTRKQMREARLTGATTVITPEEADAAKNAQAAASAPATPQPDATDAAGVEEAAPVQEEPKPEPAVEHDQAEASGAAPLTRRQIREQERVRTASVPLVEEEPAPPAPEQKSDQKPEPTAPEPHRSTRAEARGGAEKSRATDEPIVSEVPRATPTPPAPIENPAPERDSAPVGSKESAPASDAPQTGADTDEGPHRPIVRRGFGEAVLSTDDAGSGPQRSFDELLSSDGGSQHSAPNALIFQQAPGVGSLSGPVAATGEILVTGSYELPEGLGSQGHARGTADGKEVDAVLVDGELPPASSPTPIAASSAISTIKPAGEVIRPPEPEKSNKLMIALTITAGALAVALVGALIVAITTGVFS
ncbi:hypothetical protein G3H63_13325 [Microbacterium resistens]|uniref:hypothetical protein n=1 Tax=Microbacterium resistens TaxID=156977 RepID=UPI001C586D86|nr:hypothetical protein [Microbacterium resistens]MBW1640045.1 hypothetical protein [Microbacterium resistens]